MTRSRKIPPLHKSLHSRLWSRMFPLQSNSCKESRKAAHTHLTCKICCGCSTGILLFLRKKNQNLILKWRYLKARHKRDLFWGLVSSREAALCCSPRARGVGGGGPPCACGGRALASTCLFPKQQWMKSENSRKSSNTKAILFLLKLICSSDYFFLKTRWEVFLFPPCAELKL